MFAFLPKLLELCAPDDNGSGPGIKAHCSKHGMVRLQVVSAMLVGPEQMMLWAPCPHGCGQVAVSEVIAL